MSEYVPTTDEMIECVCGEGAIGYERAEFDRWLSSVKADALDAFADELDTKLGESGPGNRNTGYGQIALDLLRLMRIRADRVRQGVFT